MATVTLSFPGLTSGTAAALTIAMLRPELFRIVVEAPRLTSLQPSPAISQVTEGTSLVATALRHGDFVDERVPFDRQHDVGGFHWVLAGVVGPGDGEDDGPGPDAEAFGFGGEGGAGADGFLGVGDVLADDGHPFHDAVPGVRAWPLGPGLCPGNHESAGKRHSGRRRHGNQHLQSLLVECAWAAVRHDGYLKSLYHRHVMKWGGYRSPTAKKKAIIVVAHALIIIIWHILATGKPYHELGAGYFTTRLDPERETRRLIAKLEALGHQVSLQPAA